MLKVVARFDDRPVDFLTGKRMPLAPADRKVCACCGLKISKGCELSNGDKVGEDCADTISTAQRFPAGLDGYIAHLARIGWKLRPNVKAYIVAA